MTTINDTYINAILADASYVEALTPNLTGNLLRNKLTDRMTLELAQFIGRNFTSLTQEDNNGSILSESSFDATVWQGNAGTDYEGKVYVSMRGSQQALDFVEDADLATSGLAHEQLVEMVNWWLRETTPVGEMAKQLTIQNIDIPFSTIDIENFVAADSVQGTGLLAGVTTIESVNGHSLGGYMATAFARIFGDKWTVESINTFNSAGYLRAASVNIENGFNQIAEAIGTELGLDHFNGAAQNNYFAENGINFTTNTWDPEGFKQYGERVGVFQEDLTPLVVNNHFMYKLTDLLALGNVLEQLDPNFTLTDLSALVPLASNRMAASYESVLDGLRELLLGENISPTLIADASSGAARDDYHNNIAELQTPESPFTDFVGKVNISLATSANLASLVLSGDKAALYTLLEAQAFIIRGVDQATSDRLYSATGKDLDIANYSEQFIQDRVLMFEHLMISNEEDVDFPDSQYKIAFNDVENNISFFTNEPVLDIGPRDRYTFGDSADNFLAGPGSKGDDHFYGMAGSDTLVGQDGDDYLEGGLGNDTLDGGHDSDTLVGGAGNDALYGSKGNDYLEGGKGDDAYHFYYGDGRDRIVDNGESGESNALYLTHEEGGPQERVGSLTLVADSDVLLYVELDEEGERLNNTTYLVLQTPTEDDPDHESLFISIDGGAGGSITLEHWAGVNNTFGISLFDEIPITAPEQPVTSPAHNVVLEGGSTSQDDPPIDDGLYSASPGEFRRIDAPRLSVSRFNMEENVHFIGSNHIDSLNGGYGDDVLDSRNGTLPVGYENSHYEDFARGSLGNDYLIGGEGKQVLRGNGGFTDRTNPNESNLATFPNVAELVVVDDEVVYQVSDISHYADDDYLSGGKGEDRLNGDEGQDYILGGEDDDIVAGGAGDDSLYGGEGNDSLLGDGIVEKFFSSEFYSQEKLTAEGLLSTAFLGGVTISEFDGLHTYDDYIDAGAGDDYVIGGIGHDTVLGGEGDDNIEGDNTEMNSQTENGLGFTDYFGVNRFYSEALTSETYGNDVLLGGAGNDTIVGHGGNDILDGGEGQDLLFGDASNVDEVGGEFHGNDTVSGGNGDDQITGGGADDHLEGGKG